MDSSKRISKILLKAGQYFIFSYKNSRRPGLDGKLELIGGNIETGESPFEGLIRELNEEETSGTLWQMADKLKPKPEKINVNNQEHFIYIMNISRDDYKKLIHEPAESYGFELIENTVVTDKDKFCKNSKKFTLKTIKIFDQLHAAGFLKQIKEQHLS